jgi:hypothetical protein
MGRVADLDRAISTLEEISSTDSDELPISLTVSTCWEHAHCLFHRSEQGEALDDLDYAIQLCEKALEKSPRLQRVAISTELVVTGYASTTMDRRDGRPTVR